MGLTATSITISILLLLFVLMITLYLFKNREKSPSTTQVTKHSNEKHDFRFTLSHRELDNEGLISVFTKSYHFNYQPKDYERLQSQKKALYTSLSLIQESKYEDILQSRKDAVHKTIKNLLSLTSLTKEDITELQNEMNHYLTLLHKEGPR
jgi:hypothetical protein